MNKSKLVQRTIEARKRVRNLAITLLPGDKISVINMNTLKMPIVPDAKSLMIDMTQVKHNWSVLLCIFGRCPVTGEYWKTLDVSPGQLIYSNQIEDSLREHHEGMVNNFNKKHFVSIGWIAKPNKHEFNNDDMYKLFQELGAWDYLAKWEQA